MADAQRGRASGGWTRLKFPGFAAWENELTGQAKIFAGPAGRHLTRAEPVLKRSIPILIIAFLFVVGISRMVGIVVEHDRMDASVKDTTSLTALAVGAVFSGPMAESLAKSDRMAVEAALSLNLPQDRMQPGGLVLFVEEKGRVFGASLAAARYVGQSLARFSPELAATQYFGDPASVFRTRISGQDYYASLVQMPRKGGFVIVANPLGQVALFWRDEVALNVTLFAGISAILLVILYAYYIQAKRARDADSIFAESNLRVETALARGRSGLWDFDLSNRRLFWSRSMYEMLGMPPRDSVLSFGDAARLMHPDDDGIYQVARAVARGEAKQVDQVFRMRHAEGHYVWLRARAQLIRMASGRMHMIGIAMDVTEQHRLAQRYQEPSATRKPTSGLPTPSNAPPRPSCCGTRTTGSSCATRITSKPMVFPTTFWFPAPNARQSMPPPPARSSNAASPMPTAPARHRRAKCSSPTNAGFRSTSGARAMAASSPSAPTSP